MTWNNQKYRFYGQFNYFAPTLGQKNSRTMYFN